MGYDNDDGPGVDEIRENGERMWYDEFAEEYSLPDRHAPILHDQMMSGAVEVYELDGDVYLLEQGETSWNRMLFGDD